MAPPKDSSPSRTRSGKSQVPKPSAAAAASTHNPSDQHSSSQHPNLQTGTTVQPASAVVASVPLIPPPSSNANTFASYGNLNLHDPVRFIQATADDLKDIVATARPMIRKPLPTNVTKDGLLNEIFRLRQHEAMRSMLPDTAPASSLSKLMAMPPQDIFTLSETDPNTLQSLMHSALVADPSLSPRNFSLSDPGKLAATAITWQFQTFRQAHDLQQTPEQPSAVAPSPRRVRFPTPEVTTPTLAPDTQPPPNLASLLDDASQSLLHEQTPDFPPQDDSSDDSDDGERRPKKQKSHVNPLNYNFGAGSAIRKSLRAYPGSKYSSRTLHVDSMLGSRILSNWISQGVDVPTFWFHFKWKQTTSGMPTQSQIEAHTLGRIIHLDLLTSQSPQVALDSRPSLEVALRRLYAILYVEESMRSGIFTDKGLAWKNTEHLLESHPTSSVLCDDIAEEMTRHVTQQRKRFNAVQTLEKARNQNRRRTQRPDNQPNMPPPTPPKKAPYRR